MSFAIRAVINDQWGGPASTPDKDYWLEKGCGLTHLSPPLWGVGLAQANCSGQKKTCDKKFQKLGDRGVPPTPPLGLEGGPHTLPPLPCVPVKPCPSPNQSPLNFVAGFMLQAVMGWANSRKECLKAIRQVPDAAGGVDFCAHIPRLV